MLRYRIELVTEILLVLQLHCFLAQNYLAEDSDSIEKETGVKYPHKIVSTFADTTTLFRQSQEKGFLTFLRLLVHIMYEWGSDRQTQIEHSAENATQ